MPNSTDNLSNLFSKLNTPTVPINLEKRVIQALHSKQQRIEIFSRRIWSIAFVVSVLTVLAGITATWQALSTGGLPIIVQAAFSNLSALRPSDLFWGLIENLPLNSLAMTFSAGTAMGWLTSLKKREREHLLHLKLI